MAASEERPQNGPSLRTFLVRASARSPSMRNRDHRYAVGHPSSETLAIDL